MDILRLRGQVLRTQSGYYLVETQAGQFSCQMRGRLKKGPRVGDIVAIGDWVQISQLTTNTGMIEAVEPRLRMISRLAPTPQGEYEQIIIANPDQAVFVFSCEQPEPHLGMLDRFLVISEKQKIPAVIVANKIDLVEKASGWSLFSHYPALGYPVVLTSAKTGYGLDVLRRVVAGKLSVFTGPSGAGKSSLLNALIPGYNLKAREISQASSKGKHTTVVRELYPLAEGGYIADTPGLKALALWDTGVEELDGYFPEMRQLVECCQFNDCTHTNEPGCAVISAVQEGTIHPMRYRSYLQLRTGEE